MFSLARQMCRYFLFLLAYLFAVQPATANQPLSVDIESSGYDSWITISATNNADYPVTFLIWNTPFEENLFADVFDLSEPSKGWPLTGDAAYIGYEVRRWIEDESAYITLEPGASISRSHDLSTSYSVDKIGLHQLRYQQDLLVVEPESLSRKAAGNKETKNSFLEQRRKSTDRSIKMMIPVAANANVLMHRQQTLTPRFVTPTITSCSASQRNFINETLGRSEVAVADVLSEMLELDPEQLNNSPRYRAWFGEFDTARHDRVINTFQRMSDGLESQPMSFDCACILSGRESLFGFIRRAQPWRVNLCPLFFSIPDEEIVTITHELSHFNEVGPTDDFAYGPAPVQSLAISQPEASVRNGDSYGYFSANNMPALPLIGDGSQNDVPQDFSSLFVPLEAGEVVSNTVAEGDFDLFVVAGASSIELESQSGDADLLVFADAGLENLICFSEEPAGTLDQCELENQQTVFIAVFGFADSTYNLSSTGIAPVSNITELVPDQATNGFLARGDADFYRVSGVRSITLDSTSGDSDLYVFNSDRFDTASLVCESFLATNRDFCEVPPNDEFFIAVVGFEDSQYTLVGSSGDALEGNSDITITALNAGQTVTGSVGETEIELFTFTGDGRLDLVSNTGDADLFVYADGNFDEAFCISDSFSSASSLDSCDIPQGSFVAAVYGFTPANYELTLVRSNDVLVTTTTNTDDSDADGLPAVELTTGGLSTDELTTGESGGGGGLAFYLPMILLVFGRFSGYRRRNV